MAPKDATPERKTTPEVVDRGLATISTLRYDTQYTF